jgi:hypothetical protein
MAECQGYRFLGALRAPKNTDFDFSPFPCAGRGGWVTVLRNTARDYPNTHHCVCKATCRGSVRRR